MLSITARIARFRTPGKYRLFGILSNFSASSGSKITGGFFFGPQYPFLTYFLLLLFNVIKRYAFGESRK